MGREIPPPHCPLHSTPRPFPLLDNFLRSSMSTDVVVCHSGGMQYLTKFDVERVRRWEGGRHWREACVVCPRGVDDPDPVHYIQFSHCTPVEDGKRCTHSFRHEVRSSVQVSVLPSMRSPLPRFPHPRLPRYSRRPHYRGDFILFVPRIARRPIIRQGTSLLRYHVTTT